MDQQDFSDGTPAAGTHPEPRVLWGDMRKTALLDAAEELLRHKEPDAISIEAIARAAGLSRSSVYFYFDNKNAIIATLIGRAVNRMMATFGEELAKAGEASLDTTLARILKALVGFWHELGFLYRIGDALVGSDPDVRLIWDDAFARCAQMLVDIVRRDRAAGFEVAALPETDYERALALSHMANRNIFLLFTREHTDAEEDELIDILTFLALRGLGYPASS
ncbi:TetR/AcrR family transcriptional regulator [Streptomyces mayteni]